MANRPSPPRPAAVALAVLAVLLATGCSEPGGPQDYVARVGTRHLTREQLAEAMAALPAEQDSAGASQQVIEQWVTDELLYQAALDRDLEEDPGVRRALEESRRSVLVNALIGRLYEENPAAPTPAEVQAYFERHREQLRLLEPYVRVRYLATRSAGAADDARRTLVGARTAEQDSVWRALVDRLAVDAEGSRRLSERYVAERQLFATRPALRAVLDRLRPGQAAPVLADDSLYHVLQFVGRVPAGTVPEPSWIEDELMRRLIIEARKQLYARQVQRLRTEALAREELEIRP